MDLEIIKIAEDTNNNKDIKNHTHCSKLKNHLCGDEIQIKLIVKNNKIIKFGYEGKSCVYCLAAASLLSKVSIDKEVMKINELCDDSKLFFEGNSKIIDKWKIMKKLFKEKKSVAEGMYFVTF
ncbi:iron-sulfur cluster assembly scaffold protein [Candidatus Pelagibacter sp.]|nr:iron-sulfur cluster assembly scaffold protein [Candidatus Pelagibacter sp.]